MTMNLKTNSCKPQSAVALVITLLMLAVITFLAIAFLAMTSRDKSSVTASLDYGTAKSMSDSALARAQAEIIARMMASNDILSYDYTVSHSYVNPQGYTIGDSNDANVNYDFILNGTTQTPYNSGSDPADWAQNIANLYYDPRPPVFVQTNSNPSAPFDFRYYVDLNRNKMFESNGTVTIIDPNGNFVAGPPLSVAGEPEWVGILKYPETNHSVINPFIGRYAYMVLPIGKTLDLNYINNHAKFAGASDLNMQSDGFIRDQGVGSWELNLAAAIENLGPMFQTNKVYGYSGPGTSGGAGYYGNPYEYSANLNVPPVAPMGSVNFDALEILGFRYGFTSFFPPTLFKALGNPALNLISNIDEYGIYPSLTYPFDYQGNPSLSTIYTKNPWPSTYSSNTFYDVQDFFDATKVGSNFANNLFMAGTNIDTTNRYTFQRLLGAIGMGSQPEYGVYVYSNFFITNPFIAPTPPATTPVWQPFPPQTLLRTKVNINYDNTAQIQAGPYDAYGKFTPMPTNLQAWTALGFFTNAADLLLRSQIFAFTNYVTNAFGQLAPAITVPNLSAFSNVYMGFGITNIPVYVATNPGIVYNEQVHRMLQLAANIYADAYSNTLSINTVERPPVFRPLFQLTNAGTPSAMLTIIGYTNVPPGTAYNQLIQKGFKERTDPTIAMNDNVWGVPWVVGAVKGIPSFDQYTYQNRVSFARQLEFVRNPSTTQGQYQTAPPFMFTNQFYFLSVSNLCGMDAWNPYSTPFSGASGTINVVAYSYVTVTITNNYNWGFTTNVNCYTGPNGGMLGGYTNVGVFGTPWLPNTFKTLLQTNIVALPPGYFSDSLHTFVPATNGIQYIFPSDTNQTTYPQHIWSATITNHCYYALFDGIPTSGSAALLDFVNLGPFGSSFPITAYLTNFDTSSAMWAFNFGSDAGGPLSTGEQAQISYGEQNDTQFAANMVGGAGSLPASQQFFSAPGPISGNVEVNGGSAAPTANCSDAEDWMAADPLVHYTIGDLYTSSPNSPSSKITNILGTQLTAAWTLPLGSPNARYTNAIQNTIMLYGDPAMNSANAWQFPSNFFPNVGWLGRVHRGTPWQTVYLKSDSTVATQVNGWNSYTTGNTPWVNSYYTYPTNDWQLVDLFTTVPNDNAARGLLSVNQTSDAAWAAVLAGVVVITNATTGVPLNPTNDVANIVDAPNGINAARLNAILNTNQIFHKIGDILQAPALTVANPYVVGAGSFNDEVVERIPQQTLGLLKLGMPQFVIYAWGQSLRPKNLYSGSNPNLVDLCTNYEITGEYLTRTVCHLASTDGVATNAPRIVVDSFNIEPNP